jgi:uncharacterized protein YyaL (SSP411 family)
MASDYANAIQWVLSPPAQVNIVGKPNDPATKGLVAESWKTFQPRKVIQVLDPERDEERIKELGYRLENKPIAYVCLGKVCLAPVSEPKQVAVQLAELLAAKAS